MRMSCRCRGRAHSPASGGSSAGCGPSPMQWPWAERLGASSLPDASSSGWVPDGASSYPIWAVDQASFPVPQDPGGAHGRA